MKLRNLILCGASLMALTACQNQSKLSTVNCQLSTVGNPYMPLWEHIPDGEPYVFEDPDQPGKYRVYVYGSHDNLIDAYCGRDQVVWSASVDSLNNWRYDGEILVVGKNRDGEPFDSAGTADVLYAPDVTLVTDKDGNKIITAEELEDYLEEKVPALALRLYNRRQNPGFSGRKNDKIAEYRQGKK